MKNKIKVLAFSLVVLTFVFGCNQEKTYDLSLVSIGQTKQQLIADLGEPQESWKMTVMNTEVVNYWYGNAVVGIRGDKIVDLRQNLSDAEITEIKALYSAFKAVKN